MHDTILPVIAFTIVICSLCQWIAWRLKLPAIIFLLFTGIIAGPVLGLIDPDKLLGDLLFPFVSLSVAIILFEGSLTLKFSEIRGLQKVVRNMVSFGMIVTWLITTATTRYALGLSWEISFLFGAVTVVTGPTVIVPMLRTVRPTASISNILRWEGIVIDPIGASLAVLVYEFIISAGGQQAWGHTFLTFINIIAVGCIIGAISGYIFGITLRKHCIPEFLHNVTTLSLVFGSFALSNILQPESGLVTVTIMGMFLANMKGVDMTDILDFKESLSILLISLLFIMLAARLDLMSLKNLGWPVLYTLLAIQFLARPLNIMISTLGSKLSWPERHLLAWIAPRGIIAAAISALFALQLENAGFADAELLVPLTFSVIIWTVFLQSTTARPIANWLGVAEPEPKGFLIIGSNIVSRAIARNLIQHGLRILIADTSWDRILKAKMEGLDTYHGNPISEHADLHLDLVGIGRILALSPHESINVSAVMRYRVEFGPNNAFVLQSKSADNASSRLTLPTERRGKILFGKDITYGDLSSILEKNDQIHTTKLTDTFSLKDFHATHNNNVVILFALDLKEKLHVFTAEHKINPTSGWSLIYLSHDRQSNGNNEINKSSKCLANSSS